MSEGAAFVIAGALVWAFGGALWIAFTLLALGLLIAFIQEAG